MIYFLVKHKYKIEYCICLTLSLATTHESYCCHYTSKKWQNTQAHTYEDTQTKKNQNRGQREKNGGRGRKEAKKRGGEKQVNEEKERERREKGIEKTNKKAFKGAKERGY